MAVKESYVNVKEIVMKAPKFSNAAKTSNIAGVIVAPTGPKLAYIQSPAQFLSTYTKDGKVPRKADSTFINAYYLSYAAGLVIARATNTNAVSGIMVRVNDGNVTLANCRYKDGSLMTKISYLTVTLKTGDADWGFVLGSTVYYKGILNEDKYKDYQDFVECDDLTDLASQLENIDNVNVAHVDSNKTTLTVVLLHTEEEKFDESGDDLYIDPNKYDGDISSAAVTGTSSTSNSNTYDVYTKNQNELFSIKMKVTNCKDDYAFKIGKTYSMRGHVAFDLHVTDRNYYDESLGQFVPNEQIYRVSLDPDCYDENGVNLYIDYLNTQDLPFEVNVLIDQDTDIPQWTSDSESIDTGDDGYNQKESKKDSNLMAALNTLQEQELYDIEYLASFGVTSMPYVKRLQSVGTANKWFCPIDAPYQYVTFTAVKRYFDNLGVDAQGAIPSGIALGPFDKNSSLTGWINYIAPSTLYWERVMVNKASSAEFAPVFKYDYGTLNYNNPTKLFKKSERETLLSMSKPVNWACYSQKRNIYYLNDNRTYQSQDNTVKEEQNARIVWKISKDLKRVLDQFIGKYNTAATRQKVHDVITYYFNWNIMNQRFAPDAFDIVCDETNNTAEIIRENKLACEVKVRLYNAIKYIEVINRVFPLGVDFNTSITE